MKNLKIKMGEKFDNFLVKLFIGILLGGPAIIELLENLELTIDVIKSWMRIF